MASTESPARPKVILENSDLHNALVIVRIERGWEDYAVPFSMNRADLTGDVIYARECSTKTEDLLRSFSDRSVYIFDRKTLR